MAGLQMKYFVLKPEGNSAHNMACRQALRAYADAIRPHNSELADDLGLWAASLTPTEEFPNTPPEW